ncbi:MAG: trypsin-like peptidase domain-containing protein [Candidatus Pacearchaeota archaeon]|jgi:S1-C subfamily serine protease
MEKINKINNRNDVIYLNGLIILVIVMIIVQGAFIIYSINKTTLLEEDINSLKLTINRDIKNEVDTNNIEIQSKINELSDKLMTTESDLKKEVGNIKAKTSSDFSGIIEHAVNSVVSVRTNVAQGTGFIISEDGYVITNAHVLSGAKYAEAITSDKEVRKMSLVGYNLPYDIALLKINGDFQNLELDDSNEIRVGEKVIAIGNPLGLSFSVSEGIISGIHREGDNEIKAYIQTDASLNPGNSGGPLINTNGKVIGINNFKLRGENLGFALESNYIKEVVNEISIKSINKTIIN